MSWIEYSFKFDFYMSYLLLIDGFPLITLTAEDHRIIGQGAFISQVATGAD